MMPISPKEYNEIAGYIFHNYQHLLSEDEWSAFNTKIIEGRDCYKLSAEKLLENGVEKFYTNVVNRILKENKGMVIFNKCPKCKQLCITPKAKQCRNSECMYDWHN